MRVLYAISTGQGFFGRFSNAFTSFGVLFLLLDKAMPIKLTTNAISTGIILLIVICYFIGKFLMFIEFDRMDNQVTSERNPLLKDIHCNTVKECEKL
jgi:hypothetical protein